MIQVDLAELAKPEMNKSGGRQIGAHYKVPCNLALYARLMWSADERGTSTGVRPLACLDNWMLNRRIRMASF